MLFVLIALPSMLPGFIRYITESRIVKNVAYGKKFRHQLDIYLPVKAQSYIATRMHHKTSSPKLPVLVFLPGGAWIIGYKCWAYMLSIVLMENDVIVIVPDYRNFPEVSCGQMCADVDAACDWVLKKCEELGGDPENITLSGQSAGAHLTAAVMLFHVKKYAVASPFRRYVGMNGPYDLSLIIPAIHAAGLRRKIVIRGLFENNIDAYDPVKIASTLTLEEVRLLPSEIVLWQGEADATCPWRSTPRFADAMTRRGYLQVRQEIFPGETHTSQILENILHGKLDLAKQLIELLHGTSMTIRTQTVYFPWCARIAAYVNPF